MYTPPDISQYDSSTQLISKMEYFSPFTSAQIFNNKDFPSKLYSDSKLAFYNQSTLTVLNFETKMIPNYTWDDLLDENLEVSIKFKPKNIVKIKAKIIAVTRLKPKFELY